MKTGNAHLFKVLTIAAMLLLASRSQALFTTNLTIVSNNFAFIATTLTNDTPQERALSRALNRALKDLSKPSDSVAGDYKLFAAAATHLGPFALQPPFGEAGSNLFNFFMNQAVTQIIATGNRIAALNQFVVTKKPASNQLARAAQTLNSIPTTSDPRRSIFLGGQVYLKIVAANKLAAIGEAHSGFARNTVVGKRLEHTEQGETGSVYFNNNTQATQDADLDSTYTYTRTGLNTATLVLVRNEGTSTSTTTVKLRFTSANAGRFTFRNEDSDGGLQRGAGTFTID